jgi:ketosteroid isomerase-like protein
MAPELAELVEKQAIRELVWAYSRAVDRHDFALLRSLYTDDGIDDHGGIYCGPADGFVAWLRVAMAKVETSHAVHNHQIVLTDDGAIGEAYVTAYNRIPNGQGGFDEFIQGLRYIDRYRKEAGWWRFVHRKVAVDYAQHRPAFWDFEHPLLKGKCPALPGPDDVSYALLQHPLFARGGGRG